MSTVSALGSALLLSLLMSSSQAVAIHRPQTLHHRDNRGQRTLHQAATTSDIPQRCMDTGLNLQSACSSEIEKASKVLGVGVGNGAAVGGAPAQVDQAKLNAYIADPASNPSAGCCQAAATFNSARCSCEANVLELVKSFTNNDLALYGKVSAALARTCKFKLIYGRTCRS